MSKASEIKRLLREISNNNGKSDNRNLFITAEVVKVHDETCDVDVAGMTLTGIHLAAVSDGNKNNLIIKPRVGSVVLICDKTGGDMAWMNVVAYSEIASITGVIDEDVTLKIKGNVKIECEETIELNGGNNGGLVKIKELTDELNGLKDALNNFISNYNSHIHVTTATVGAGPSAGVISATVAQATSASSFNRSDYENDKIKH